MNKKEDYQKFMSLLSYALDHRNNSNLSLVIKAFNDSIFQQKKQLHRIKNWTDIDKAQGKVLDSIGQNYGVSRIDADDDFYRFLIKIAKLKNHSDGSVNEIINIISTALNADPTEFVVKFGYEIDGEPLALRIDNIPNKYNDNPRKTKLMLKYLEESLAAGIRLIGMTFQENNTSNLYIGMTSVTMEEETNVMKSNFEIDNSNKQFIAISTQTQFEETNTMKGMI